MWCEVLLHMNANALHPAAHADITGRADIERLVNAFYEKVRGDDATVAGASWSNMRLPAGTGIIAKARPGASENSTSNAEPS